MRQKNETTTSFNQLKEITQIMQMQKWCAKTSDNAETSEITHESAPKSKARANAKNNALKPTKKAFSERQNTAFIDNSQARANLSFKTKASQNTNALKTEQANNSNLREKPSDEALKQGLTTHQNNQKGDNNAKAK
ncbi:hypothetical protein ACLGAT_04350 [Helicobacter pylori]